MTERGRVVVVGLGPAGADLLVPAARAVLMSAAVSERFVRTARHPAVAELEREGVNFTTLDECYESGADLDTVYGEIVRRVAAAAQAAGSVVYAVPGSPNVAERTVALLHARDDIDLEIVPGLSLADLAWSRLGIDPLAGARVVDARAFAIEGAGLSGPMLLAQCDTPAVLSDVKLALLEVLDPDHEVVVLARLGLPDERVERVAVADLDRAVTPDHLTSCFVDTGEVAVAAELARLVALTERLRGPGGCPWDAEQTHASLRRHVLEEAYEVAEAIDALPEGAPAGIDALDADAHDAYDALEDELGDLLFQVMIQSVLAAETGAFTVADVAARVHDKLVRRHPHVFGDVTVHDASDVVTNWEQIKKSEKQHTSLVEGITNGLPPLLLVQKLFRKAQSIGLEPGSAESARLIAAVEDAEAALRDWARQFKDRFQRMEKLAAERGIDLATAAPPEIVPLWEQAGS